MPLGVLSATAQASIAIFLLGMAYRLLRWASSPLKGAHSTPLGLSGWAKVAWNVLLDLAFMRKAFRSNPTLGAATWFMHLSVLAILLGHMRAFGVWSAEAIPPSIRWIALGLVPTLLGLILMALLLGLLARRLARPMLRGLLSPRDALFYALLLVGVAAGLSMRLLPHADAPLHWEVAPGIVLSLEHTPNIAAFTIHVVAMSALLAYLPFSPLIHVVSGIASSAIYYRWRLVVHGGGAR
ncbi:hypothetical protein B6U99_04955 [Candidatus Geothermarchaeota archaeon ex4572_27]|nr:MAG: hypothetical protein B6U99_04955 [Candidatus Geothermarchaeota archaeon ex4572_27]